MTDEESGMTETKNNTELEASDGREASECSGLLCCDDCGKANEDVRSTNCPYAEEIYDSIVPCNLCSDCYHERCMDI